MKKVLLLLICLTFSANIVLADDGCCRWFWWRRPSASITVSGQNSQMHVRLGQDDGYYRHHHHRKYKKHKKRWKHRYCDDCWDD